MTANLATRRYRLGLGLFTESAKYFAGWIAFIVIGAAVVPAIVAQFRSIDISSWYHAANVGKIFTAIVAGGFVYTLLPNMVAQGVTRRELSTAVGLFGLMWSAGTAAIAVAGFVAEHAYYGAFGWTQAIDQDRADVPLESFAEAAQFGLHYPLVYLLYFTGGALIGAAFYGSDGGWLILVPTIPITLALDDMVSGGDPWGPGWLVRGVTGLGDHLNPWVSALIGIAFVILGAWITRRLILGSSIHPKQA